MPSHDPSPPRAEPQPQPFRRRFVRIMRWGAAFSVAIAALAAALVARGDSELHWHMLIATALGAGLTVMMGIALMSLIFLSNSSGHDDSAANFKDEHDQRS